MRSATWIFLLTACYEAYALTSYGDQVSASIHRRRQPSGFSSDIVPSAGCSGQGLPSGETTFNLEFSQHGLDTVTRVFGLFVPEQYSHAEPSPLVIVFHGWGDEPIVYHNKYGFKFMARGYTLESELSNTPKHNFISVYPVGLKDCVAGSGCYTSWNAVGSAQSTSEKMSCDPQHQPWDYCYRSCQLSKPGGCHACDYTSCYDDVAFIGQILDHLEASLCIDLRRIYAWGCSNGGQMAHELAQSLPGKFAAIVTSCGARPHTGWETNLPNKSFPPVSVLLVGGTEDKVMPQQQPSGSTEWWDGYLYAGVHDTTKAYAEYNNCIGVSPRSYPTRYNASSMMCTEDGHECDGDANVVRCVFNGPHGINLKTGRDTLPDELQLAWSFFSRHKLHDRRQ